MSASRVLFLDFDGVLHPAKDSVHLPTAPMPAWQIQIALQAQGRFVWASRLEDVLIDASEDLRMVIHSTWRRRFSDSELVQFLPRSLGQRVIRMDGRIASRHAGSSDDYVADVIDLLCPKSALVIDDRSEFFPPDGRAQERLKAIDDGRFLVVDQDRGISDESVLGAISRWAGGGHVPEIQRSPCFA